MAGCIKDKVELHVHLDGALRPETVLEFGRKRGIRLPANNVEDLKEFVCVKERPGDFMNFLSTFDVFLPCIAGDQDAIWRMAYEFCKDSANQNVRYVEARYSPHILANDSPEPPFAKTSGNLSPRKIVEIVSAAFKQASHDFGIIAKCILCCILNMPEWSPEVLKLCEEFRNDGVVAIDLAAGEHSSPADTQLPRHLEAFRQAHQLGIHRTMHAGEIGDSESVRRAVDLFYAERIGHGYRVLDDPELYQDLRERRIHFEVCPNSAILTGAFPEAAHDPSLHAAKRFADDKVNFSINSDDPLPFNTNITKEFEFAAEIGLSHEQLVDCIFNAVSSSFAPDHEKEILTRHMEQEYGRREKL